MLKIGFDVGGVLSKDKRWRELALILATYAYKDCEIYIITDIHDNKYVLDMLECNNLDFIPAERVYCSNHEKYGEACKAVLLKELEIDIFFDDFMAYLQWDSQLGPAPLRCLVMPDWQKPYWHENWSVTGEDGRTGFGRRNAPASLVEKNNE